MATEVHGAVSCGTWTTQLVTVVLGASSMGGIPIPAFSHEMESKSLMILHLGSPDPPFLFINVKIAGVLSTGVLKEFEVVCHGGPAVETSNLLFSTHGEKKTASRRSRRSRCIG
mmetsp:Transcript_19505/g.28866  ORF Transcript_19505/g.28866 Transcript_19505/m.28866 type:complete len:114 (-) Transcript_19505:82-423(-)